MIQRARTRNGKTATKAAPKTMRVAIYCRKSNRQGLDLEVTSLDAQREAVLGFIANKRADGWAAIPTRYEDGGFTGANTDRPAFQRLLKDIEAGLVDAVAVYKIDRLSRSQLDFIRTMQFFEEHGVAFVSTTQSFDTSTSIGRLILSVLISFAQFEREQAVDRIRDKKAASRRRGLWPGGRAPLGFDLIDKRLVINKREAEVVRGIYEAYLRLGSLPAVAEYCRRQGWKAKRHRYGSGRVHGGTDFSHGALSRILKNPVYAGKLRGDDGLHEGVHEAIVGEEVWRYVQKMLKANHGERRRPRQSHNVLLGGGLLKCGVCGATMGHMTCRQGGRVYRYYRCRAAMQRGASACPGSRVAAADIEQFVLGKIRDIGKDADVIARAMEAARDEFEERKPALVAELQRLGQERQQLEGQQQALLDGLGDDAERPKVVVRKLQRLEEEIDGLASEQQRIRTDLAAMKGQALVESDLREALADFDQVWAELFEAEKARIAEIVVEHVEYHAQKGEVAITYRPGGLQALFDEREGDDNGSLQG
jgi:site-specific DNA recombinase